MSLILGIESTCDETGAAVVRDGIHVLSNVVATQIELHAKYRGIVPEIASRAHIENIFPVINESLTSANCGSGRCRCDRGGSSARFDRLASHWCHCCKNARLVAGQTADRRRSRSAHLYSVMLKAKNENSTREENGVWARNEVCLFVLSGFGPGRQRRSYGDVRCTRAGPIFRSLARRSTMRSAKPTTRSLRFWASVIPADRSSTRWREGEPGAVKLPRSMLGRSRSIFHSAA